MGDWLRCENNILVAIDQIWFVKLLAESGVYIVRAYRAPMGSTSYAELTLLRTTNQGDAQNAFEALAAQFQASDIATITANYMKGKGNKGP